MKSFNVKSQWHGLIDIDQGFALQQDFIQKNQTESIQVIGCEHFEVLSLGKSAWSVDTEVWKPHFNQIHKTFRGGQMTLHNQGQLIIYPSIYLKTLDLTITNYVQMLLEVSKLCLADFGLNVETQSKENIGVFFESKKIGSIGLRCQRGWVSHGLSINVNNDLAKFKLFDVCGQQAVKITSLAEQNIIISTEEVFEAWVTYFLNVNSLSFPIKVNSEIEPKTSL